MKKNNLLTLLGIALVVAIVSTGLFYGLFVNKLSSSTGSGKTLVVAAKALKAGSILGEKDLKSIPWPAEQLPKGGFEKIEQLKGNTLYDSVSEDEPVLSSRLTSGQGSGGVAVPEGMRAVSVHVSDSAGIMGLIRAGQHVDVQVVRKPTSLEAELRTAVEDLQVLSVNPIPEPTSQGFTLPVVTLLANPVQADVLAVADAGARVRLALRNPQDSAVRTRAPLTLDSVLRGRQ
jgi:Flp pilus assembly protein CpaB